MVTEVKYENQTLTYAGEEFYTTPQGAKAMLKKYGLAIIPSILTEEECRKMNEGMWSTAEYLTSKMEMPVNRSDPSTYFSLVKLFPKDGGLFQHFGWGHAQYVWDTRSNEKVIETYEQIFGTQDLLVSFDGINCGVGPLIEDPKYTKAQIGLFSGGHNLHCEQRFVMNDFELVQSWVNANPIKVGDGTLRVIQGSHKHHAEFREAFKDEIADVEVNWHILTDNQIEWLKQRGCRDLCIVVPSGSHVLWDSRTVHCGQLALANEDLPENMKNEPRIPRNVVYITMVPRTYADQKSLEVRRSILSETGSNRLRSATHRAHEMTLFAQPAAVSEVPRMPMPSLNDTAKKLAGIL